MRAVIVAAFVAFALTIALTPLAAKAFRRLKAGQPIRSDGPQTHLAKAGTPTMGGVVFIFTTVLAYVAGHLVLMALPEEVDGITLNRPTGFTATGIVLIGLFITCGFVGFIDDWLKIRRKHSGGISGKAKVLGLTIAATIFGLVAVYYTGSIDSPKISETVATPFISFTRDIDALNMTKIGMVVLIVLLVNATANGVNLTDGLDGLATGASMMTFIAFVVIGFWEYRHWCGGASPPQPLLRRAGPPRDRPHRRRRRRSHVRIPVVEHLARPDLHGRLRVAQPRRAHRRTRLRLKDDPAPADPRRLVRRHHRERHDPGDQLQAHRQAGLQDVADPASLRNR